MKKQIILGVASLVVAMGSSAMADGFGYYSPPTYGGSGINVPTVNSEVTTIQNGNDTIVLSSAATPRYFNPALTDNGAGTYFAGAGFGTAIPVGKAPGSTWNYDFYISLSNPANLGNYTFEVLFQTSPGAAFTTAILPVTALGESFSGGVLQDSQNLNFVGAGFDPNVTGIYNFELEVFSNVAGAPGTLLGSSDISVDVVPEVSSTSVLFALTLGGLGVYSRMRRQSVA